MRHHHHKRRGRLAGKSAGQQVKVLLLLLDVGRSRPRLRLRGCGRAAEEDQEQQADSEGRGSVELRSRWGGTRPGGGRGGRATEVGRRCGCAAAVVRPT